jgi:hypothetical protein
MSVPTDTERTLAERLELSFSNFLQYRDPNDDPDKEDWSRYWPDNRKVLMFGHWDAVEFSGDYDHDWKLEDDPVTSDMRDLCTYWQSTPYASSSSKKGASLVNQADAYNDDL